MRASKILLPIKKDITQDFTPGHQALLRGGFIQMVGAGLYFWLPLGMRVLRKISDIVRHCLDDAGYQDMLAPTMQPGALWDETGRLKNAYLGEKLVIKDRTDRDLVYGPTAEEIFTDIFRKSIKSYKQLPQIWYNIQWKFRDEIRPRAGLLRSREFLMKDAYSFHVENGKETYDGVIDVYKHIFDQLGLQCIVTESATGDIGGNFSHEFLIPMSNGDARAAIINDKAISIEKDGPVPKGAQIIEGVEAGHIFYLGTEYSEKMKAYVTLKNGENCCVEMGCYGIGISRLLGIIAEANCTNTHWPMQLAPFTANIITLNDAYESSHTLYKKLNCRDILWDDRDKSAGEKYAESDLMHIPIQIVIGPKEAINNQVLWKLYQSSEIISQEEAIIRYTNIRENMSTTKI